ncbi:MAG: hypothetical protein ACI83B_003621 [Sediminicola sp.]|jgi:hypothetical protein
MKVKVITSLSFMLFVCAISLGQMSEYNYKIELKGVTNDWHRIVLPNSVFEELDTSLNDIRIFGITAENDTIEVPYLLKIKSEKIKNTTIRFRKINESFNASGHFFTFEIPSETPVNIIKLDFEQQNFDWRVQLDGSQDNKEWFTISKDYRILSINNNLSSYQFSRISFPDSKYRYYRVFIETKDKPILNSATIDFKETKEADFQNYEISKFQSSRNSATKKTEIEITLKERIAVSLIKLNVEDSFDYYRPITIQYLTDSVETEKGWKSNYQTLSTNTLSSIEESSFRFKSRLLQKLKIIIYDGDNQPLAINSVETKGYMHELIGRFTQPAEFYLVYGNDKPMKANYDIAKFANNIPEKSTELQLMQPQLIEKTATNSMGPLFENKIWLWLMMGLIILILGYFSLKMIQK